jgi:hypothetical protein
MYDDFSFKPSDDDDNNEYDAESKERYYITSPTKFAKHIGKLVAQESGFEMEELKKLISVRQIKNYIKELGTKEGKTYTISHEELDEVCLRIHEHIIGYDLTIAAAGGTLEMYWDDTQNTMLFSVPALKDIPPEHKKLYFDEDEK